MQSLQLSRPHAIMMVGIPGSGKSYFAQRFAETFRAPFIDSLVLEQQSRDDAAAGTLIGYVLGELAKTGTTFIFEGNSDSRVRRTEFAMWARAHGYTPLFIWVQTDATTSLDRTLKARSLTKEAFAEALKGFSAPHTSEKPIVISGKHTYASQAKVVLKRLSEHNRPAAAPIASARPAAADSRRSITVRS
ncbi:MAG: AAA family ATPase [Candidatus Saccharibacteria bacterium]|nr:AAA family ATPase [Candidatus Saccharibacteria bacterium]